jgi:DnaJ-class molecular chaperone
MDSPSRDLKQAVGGVALTQVTCDACGGDGGFDEEVRDPGALYGCSSRHYECSACNGDGWIVVEQESLG